MKNKYYKYSAFLLTLSSLALLPGCFSTRGMRAQEIQMDLSVREMRSQVEELKYQLNKYEVELQIVESKADSQTASLNQVRQDLSRIGKADQSLIENSFALYDKRIEKLEMLEQTLKRDMVKLKEHTSEVLDSLAQFKTKIDNNEKQVTDQKRYIDHLRTSLEILMKHADNTVEINGTYYIVKPADTLAKIAKENDTTIDKIKDLNNISADLIVVGQKLRVK